MERFHWSDCECEGEKTSRIGEIKQKAEKAYHRGKTFVQDHATEIIVGIPAAIGAIREINKMANRHKSRKDEQRREKRLYDPSLGGWWDLKKPMTNNQMLEVEARVNNGENRGDVLRKMGLLK